MVLVRTCTKCVAQLSSNAARHHPDERVQVPQHISCDTISHSLADSHTGCTECVYMAMRFADAHATTGSLVRILLEKQTSAVHTSSAPNAPKQKVSAVCCVSSPPPTPSCPDASTTYCACMPTRTVATSTADTVLTITCCQPPATKAGCCHQHEGKAAASA
jgi:hypothetical protein